MNKQDAPFLSIPYPILMDKSYKNLTDKAVYCYLYGWETAFPGVEKIADSLGLGVSTVKESTKRLVMAGKLTKRRRFGSSNVYICADWFANEQPESRQSQDDDSTNSQNQDDEQPESGSQLAGIKTMNSQNQDTIRIDIRSSITSDLLNQLEEATEEVKDDIALSFPCTSLSLSVAAGNNNYRVDPEKEREHIQRVKEARIAKETGVDIY